MDRKELYKNDITGDTAKERLAAAHPGAINRLSGLNKGKATSTSMESCH